MTEPRDDWRRWLRWKIAVLLLFKVAALILIWLLFFSPSHRVSVNPDAMSERMAPQEREPARATISQSTQDDRDDV